MLDRHCFSASWAIQTFENHITGIPTAPTPPTEPRLWGFKIFKPESAIPKSKIAFFTGFLTLYRCRVPRNFPQPMAPSLCSIHGGRRQF